MAYYYDTETTDISSIHKNPLSTLLMSRYASPSKIIPYIPHQLPSHSVHGNTGSTECNVQLLTSTLGWTGIKQ